MNDAEPIVSVRGVSKTYDQGRVRVLDDVSFEVRRGQVVALWGASGSGKSTLLHIVGGLDVPDRGEVRVCGLDPSRKADRLTLRRLRVGFVFQLHNLIADLTVEENLMVPALAVNQGRKEAPSRLRGRAGSVGLSHRLTHRIQDLSGGERQRVALCRALMNAPDLLIADEPTGSLDEATADQVFSLLLELASRDSVAVVVATHERRFAEACHRRLRVRGGKVEE